MVKQICKFCNESFGVRKMDDHLPQCILKHNIDDAGYLIEFTSHSCVTNKTYSLYAIFGANCKFSHIDKFLKQHWCNCDCGHKTTLDVYLDFDEEINVKQLQKIVGFSSLISKYDNSYEFCYCYDMKTTTTVYFRIIGELLNTNNDEPNTTIKLIYQNDPFILKCNCKCKYKKNAILISTSDGYLLCDECSKNTDKYDKEYLSFLSPITNTPRVGICGC